MAKKVEHRPFSVLEGKIEPGIIQAIVEDMSFSHMTTIQEMVIGPLLSGKDVIATAKTGSGKTLAFLIPMVHRINVEIAGLQALIICPTRELSIQTFTFLKELISRMDPKPTCGIAIGGTSRADEAQRITRATNKRKCSMDGKNFTVSILVSTPGRLLDHINNTQGFNYRKLRMVVLDEADRILDVGFEEDLKSIFARLPDKKRQTAFFSATLSDKLNDTTL